MGFVFCALILVAFPDFATHALLLTRQDLQVPGTRRVRKPYNSLSDVEMVELRKKTEEIMPEFLAYKPASAPKR